MAIKELIMKKMQGNAEGGPDAQDEFNPLEVSNQI